MTPNFGDDLEQFCWWAAKLYNYIGKKSDSFLYVKTETRNLLTMSYKIKYLPYTMTFLFLAKVYQEEIKKNMFMKRRA